MIGRDLEQQLLHDAYSSTQSEFVAVYGRRRVGKTYLVRETLGAKFTFSHAGLANADRKSQLAAWCDSLKDYGLKELPSVQTWIDAFSALKEVVRRSRAKKKVIFIDEMPWLDTPRSGFVTALEFFWNSWASARKDIMLVICGSATSWIINNVIKNHGGLHNRVTCRINVKPFTLRECEAYASSLGLRFQRKQVLECYMIMGGVPFYWSFLKRSLSLAQNIDALFFNPSGMLYGEFDELYASLFHRPERYIDVVTALSVKHTGMSRAELIKEIGIANNGNLTTVLNDLESCGFIRKYVSIGKKERDAIYQLVDFYTLFYFKFLHGKSGVDERYWTLSQGTPTYYSWCGLAFERVCFEHVSQIKRALGIAGVLSSVYSWRSRRESSRGAQVDMLIDRNDQVITLCEMKYSKKPFAIDEEYDMVLQNKIERFREETRTSKAIHLALVSSMGLVKNEYFDDVQNVLTMNDLFA